MARAVGIGAWADPAAGLPQARTCDAASDGRVSCAEQLTKSYGQNRGIVDVDFSVEAGEVFGYLGPNGAGKSTTIRLLLDLIRPSSGRLTVFGLDSRPRASRSVAAWGTCRAISGSTSG